MSLFGRPGRRALLATTASVAGLVVAYKVRERGLRWRPDASRKGAYIPILEEKDRGFSFFPLPPGTPMIWAVSFYRGEPPVEVIKARLSAFVDKNPWAAGRLQNTPEGPRMWLPDEPNDVDKGALFVELHEPRFAPKHTQHDQEEAWKALQKQAVAAPDPFYCIDRDLPMCKVAVVRSGADGFAVVASMNHCVSDGFGFYALFNALDVDPAGAKECPSFEMCQGHDMGFEAAKRQLMGANKGAFMTKPQFLAGMAFNALVRGQQPKRSVWHVDAQWIAEQKRACGDVPFVSTNDVLTSWCLRNSTFARFGAMAVNMRDRAPNLRSAYIGNYESLIIFNKGECDEPADVRRALSDPKHLGTGHDVFPSACDCLSGRVHFVTNWATFCRDVRLPGCELLLHAIPYFDKADLPLPELSIIFNTGNGGVGLALYERSDLVSKIPSSWRRIGG